MRPVLALRHRDRIEGDLVIEVAFTGVGLDVSDHAPDAVRQRALAQVADAAGVAPVVMHQVHGADVVEVDADAATAGDLEPPVADAMLTRQQDVALLSRAADCVPVLLGDPATGTVAAVHAGRAGVVSGVVPAVVRRMDQAGARARIAWIGPHVCGSCYEVPEDMQRSVAAEVPEASSTTSWGTPALDLGAAVRVQLAEAGIDDVRTVGTCTMEDSSWPSHRRDADGVRFAGLIWSHA